MNTPLLNSITKEAIVGPLVDLDTLAIPSAIGSVFGRSVGRSNPDVQADKRLNPLIFALVPGYTGYHLGRRGEARKILREEEKATERQLTGEIMRKALEEAARRE